MKWLEIIELRTVENSSEIIINKLITLVNTIREENNEQREVKLYYNVSLKTDFSIHILHNSKSISNIGSNLGLNIVSSLKAFGLINHHIWFEIIE